MADFSLLSCTNCGVVSVMMAETCPACGDRGNVEVHEFFFDEVDHTHIYVTKRDAD